VRDNMHMTSGQRRALWATTTALGIALIAISIYLGLERAGMLGGITGSLIGLAGVAVGIQQLRSNRGSAGEHARQIQRSGNNSINLQSGNDITIGDSNRFGNSP
jgi:hypothetical protein